MTFEIKPAAEIPDDFASVPAVGRKTVYPFRRMNVGEVFVVPAGHPGAENGRGGLSRAAMAAYDQKKRTGAKFTCTRQRDGSIRIERTA